MSMKLGKSRVFKFPLTATVQLKIYLKSFYLFKLSTYWEFRFTNQCDVVGVSGLCLAKRPVSGFIKKKGEGSVVLNQFRENPMTECFLFLPKWREFRYSMTCAICQHILLWIIWDFDRSMVHCKFALCEGNWNAFWCRLKRSRFENVRSGFRISKFMVSIASYQSKLGAISWTIIGFSCDRHHLEIPELTKDWAMGVIIAIGKSVNPFYRLGYCAVFMTDFGLFAKPVNGLQPRSNEVPTRIEWVQTWYGRIGFLPRCICVQSAFQQRRCCILGEGLQFLFPSYSRKLPLRIGGKVTFLYQICRHL